jgi:hypothetical protein
LSIALTPWRSATLAAAAFALANPAGLGATACSVRPFDTEASELPTHGTVLERNDPVRNASVDERLRADDATSAPCAIHHNQRLRIWCHIENSVHEFRTWAIDSPGDAHVSKFFHRTAVEDDSRSPPADFAASSPAEMCGVSK